MRSAPSHSWLMPSCSQTLALRAHGELALGSGDAQLKLKTLERSAKRSVYLTLFGGGGGGPGGGSPAVRHSGVVDEPERSWPRSVCSQSCESSRGVSPAAAAAAAAAAAPAPAAPAAPAGAFAGTCELSRGSHGRRCSVLGGADDGWQFDEAEQPTQGTGEPV